MPLILWPLESYKAFWNSFLLCERRAVAWIILGGSLRPGHCIWGWTDIRLTWEMKRVRTEAEQVEGRQLCRWWSGKPVGNTPVWIQLYVSLHRQVTFIQELSTHCMRLGLSSRVTNLHLENTFQGTTLPLHGLCSLTFPSTEGSALYLHPVLCWHHCFITPHLLTKASGGAPRPQIFLLVLCSVEIHFSAESDALIFLAIVLLKELDTFVFVFCICELTHVYEHL